MADYFIVIMIALAVLVFLLFSLSGDKNPRSRFIGERSWSRQSTYMFVDGVVLILALVSIYILIRSIRWAWIHWALPK
jgi:hypothetical protein